jgi:hypothetical protein
MPETDKQNDNHQDTYPDGSPRRFNETVEQMLKEATKLADGYRFHPDGCWESRWRFTGT